MKVSQRKTVLRAIAPGDLVYADVPGCCAGLYQFAGVTRFGPLLLGDSVATVNWSEILPPF
ncbi:MAG: hypothetical protein WBA76_10010 [Phormidesmis sp.]